MKRKITVFFLVITVILTGITATGCGGDKNGSVIQMKVFLEWSDPGEFGMQNQDSFTWYNIDCFLNYSDNLSSGYKFHSAQLDSGNIFMATDSDFKKSDGTVYRYDVEKPVKILVQAETKDGKKGTCSRTWNNQ